MEENRKKVIPALELLEEMESLEIHGGIGGIVNDPNDPDDVNLYCKGANIPNRNAGPEASAAEQFQTCPKRAKGTSLR